MLHRNSELGLEKDYFAYMSQGISVDYAIVSPAHMSTFAKAAPLLDMPFLFRDLDHWNKVLDSDAFQPIVDDVSKKADVMIIGYAGGGTRNIIANKPVHNMAELKGLSMRVMGAPIQTQMFTAIGAKPSVIAYNEVYNAIQTGVIQGAENEAAGAQRDEVLRGRAVHLADPARDHRAADLLLRQDVPQAAAGPAGRDSEGRHRSRQLGRELESSADAALLKQLEKEGKLQPGRVHRAAEAARACRAGEAGVREGNRRDGDPEQGQRDQVATSAGAARAAPSAAPAFLCPRPIAATSGPSHAQAQRAASTAVCSGCSPLLIAVMIVPVTLQIFSRFVDFIPRYIWTEEAARFCLIWLIMLGATIAVRDGTHFDVDVLPAPKTATGKAIARIVVHVAMFLVALIFIGFGWRFALFGWEQSSEMTGINMLSIHAAWPFAGICWVPVPRWRRSLDDVKLYVDGRDGTA